MIDKVAVITSQICDRAYLWGRVVRFSHTLFALPFALSMLFVVARDLVVNVNQVAWILVALVSARTAAMGFNRIVDRDIDRLNPRTAMRELPAGLVSLSSVTLLVCVSSVVFLLSAYFLGMHCLILAPIVLSALLGYSYAKRFTACSHLILGLGLALAPGGVWYALTAQFASEPLWMMLGVLCWVAGFDIIYSLQDCDFDASTGLHSIPRWLGAQRACQLARGLHALAIVCFLIFGVALNLGVIYFASTALFAISVFSQYGKISLESTDKIDAVFFSHNAIASLLFGMGTILDVVV